MTDSDRPEYDRPVAPYEIDESGHVVDANGWVVAMPAECVWPHHMKALIATAIRNELNGHYFFGKGVSENDS